MTFIVKRKEAPKNNIRYIVRLKIPKMYRGWTGESWRHFSSEQVVHVFTKGSRKGMKVVQFIDGKERFMPDSIVEVKKQ